MGNQYHNFIAAAVLTAVGYDYGELQVLFQHGAPTGLYIVSPYIYERGIMLRTPTQGFLAQADNPSRLNTFGKANILTVKAAHP